MSGGVAFGYSDDGNTNRKESSGGTAADPVRIYQLVRYPVTNASSVVSVSNVLSAGDVVVWDTVSDDGVTVNAVNAGGMSRDAVAGVVVATITGDVGAVDAVTDIGRKNWGYIQTYGLCTHSKAVGAIAFAGQSLTASSTPGYAVVIDTGSTSNAARLGFAYDTSAATGAVEMFVDVR